MTNPSGDTDEDLAQYGKLVKYVRSSDEDDRRITITQIPNLILAHFEKRSELIKQILLLIYNLNSESDIFEHFTLANGTVIIRHLLRLYMEAARAEHKHEQVEALVSLVHHCDTSELLIELTNVLYHCLGGQQLNKEDNENIEDALDSIREKAAANMFPEALLMIHSIMAIK